MQLNQQRWARLCQALNVPAEQRFTEIAAAYAEPQRAYHTAQHIDECLTLFDSIAHHLQDAPLVELCIWLHDVIYQPKRSDNELRSAQLAMEWFARLPSDRCQKLNAYILATKHHQPCGDLDLQALLDIDLAILASDKPRFKQYSQQVRFEYKFVPWLVYVYKRRQFLSQLASRDRLFHHPALAPLLEAQARKNLG
jgi:predicted metal-dependent HD superfamily phosphohydrolase